MIYKFTLAVLAACLLGLGLRPGLGDVAPDCGPQATTVADLAAELRDLDEMKGASVLTIEKVALHLDLCRQFWSVDILTEDNDIDILIMDDATLELVDIDLDYLVILEVDLGRKATSEGAADP